jgi:NitT/TauT family transport system substrate-binding protein
MTRLTRKVATVALATALVALSGCSSSDKSDDAAGGSKELTKITYITSFGNFGRDSYAWVAKEKGFFKEAGFDVDIQAGNATSANINLIDTGKAQFSALDLTGVLLEKGKGNAKDIVAVAGIQQRTMAALMTTNDKGITTPKDLEGKTLSDTATSVNYILFPVYAKLAGVDPTKVKWNLTQNPAGLIPLLAAGQVDGIGQFVVGKPTVEAVAKGKTAVALPYSDVMEDLYGNVLVTSSKLAKDNPDEVKRFTAALIKGLEYSLDNPKEAGEILHKNVPASMAAPASAELQLMSSYVRSAGSGSAVGTIDATRVARSIAILQGAGAVPAGLAPEQFIVDMAPKA